VRLWWASQTSRHCPFVPKVGGMTVLIWLATDCWLQGSAPMGIGKTVPILRMFDEAKAREFYVDFLGFTIDWEHRFEDGAPLYMQVSNDGCVIQLSEHYGDASPGAAVRIETTELDAFQQQLAGKKYKYANPGAPQDTPWGTKELGIKDPFGNKLIFANRA
jgi:uncharacterized glyoxalase superfamily protein PhnB